MGALSTCCCNTPQIEAIVTLCVTAVITAALWRTVIFAPLKLIAVFLHEFSHASATWLTGGKVTGIEVNENFGGVTMSRGGIRWIILSAGYTGSVLWGSFFILMAWDHVPTRVAAVFFMVACVCTVLILRVQDGTICGSSHLLGLTLRIIILVIAAIPAALWVLEVKVEMSVNPLKWCMIVIGTICMLHALFDVLHDVLWKKIDNKEQGQSDAVMFANEIGGTARMWGLAWTLISLFFAALALWGHVVLAATCS